MFNPNHLVRRSYLKNEGGALSSYSSSHPQRFKVLQASSVHESVRPGAALRSGRARGAAPHPQRPPHQQIDSTDRGFRQVLGAAYV